MGEISDLLEIGKDDVKVEWDEKRQRWLIKCRDVTIAYLRCRGAVNDKCFVGFGVDLIVPKPAKIFQDEAGVLYIDLW